MSGRARSQPSRRAASAGFSTAAVVLVAVVLAGLSVVVLGWWLVVGQEGSGPHAAVAVTGASSEPAAGDGYTVWARNDDGVPVRWDPCTPLELVVSTAGAPAGFLDDLDTAVARLRDATGLDVVVAGNTDERPSGDRLPYQPDRYGRRWAPVLVAWAAPGEADIRLRDIDRGMATPISVGPAGDRTYVSGQIVLNRDRHDLLDGYGNRATSWGATLLHELAHLVGLGHVDDPDELMAVHPGTGPADYGTGDEQGLAAVGSRHGCRTVPRAQPVEVDDPR